MKFKKGDVIQLKDSNNPAKVHSVNERDYTLEHSFEEGKVFAFTIAPVSYVESCYEMVTTKNQWTEYTPVHVCEMKDYFGLNERFKWCECGKKEPVI